MPKRGFFMGLLTLCVVVVSEKVKVVNNGYEGVTIAISSDVAENDEMLTRLETFFTDASATLFRATRNLLYFREFIIVIPEEWQKKEKYEKALDSEVSTAQINIDRPNPAFGDNPYARTLSCGSTGLDIHFTPNYILKDEIGKKWGPREKVIVHEWAHYRWSVFDEYAGYEGDDTFYRDGWQWKPTRCSEEFEGSLINTLDETKPCGFDITTGKPDANCRFVPNFKDNKAVASFMFMQFVDSIKDFCDDTATAPKHLKHNKLAPNRQNRLCNHQSVWEVMRKHPDFANETEPLPDSTNTKPKFRYVQEQAKSRVLVLDTSASMSGNALIFLRQAASSAILSSFESGSKLGIVKFSNRASILSHLRELSSEQVRSELVDLLPTSASGGTSIGSGLQTGLEILKSSNSSGGTIILITDGDENQPPYIKDVKPALKERGIVVHSFAFGQSADKKIEDLSRETGGKTFLYSGQANSTGLIDGLAATVTVENRINSKANIPQPILTEAGEVTRENPMFSTFYIDTTIGKETSVTIGYTEPVEVRLQGPKTVYSSTEHTEVFRFNEISKIIKVDIPGEADAGMWSFNISIEAGKSHVTVNVQSKSREPGVDVIQVTSWIPEQEDISFDPTVRFGIYAEVRRGRAPVLNAQVSATIERPRSTPLELLLYDNGVGIDIIKNDGIYAAAVMANDLLGDGRYSIKVKVVGSEGQVKVVVNGGRSAGGAFEIGSSSSTLDTQTADLENFQRVTAAGEFRIQGFSGTELRDEMAPSRITDLRVTSFDLESLRVNLQWTSVGDDMERGTATEYQIHISEDFDQLMFQTNQTSKISQENVLKGNLSQPHPSGTLEKIELKVQPVGDNTTILLGVMAVDETGNRGDVSNLVTLSIARELSIPYVANNKANSGNSMIYLAITVPLAVSFLR